MYDLMIRNGVVVSADGLFEADLAVIDGLIVKFAPELEGEARQTIDARGLHIFPGLIDAHVHFNEPGRTDWEGWASGTRALAAGGGTLCFEMPLNASPPTLDAASFRQKLAAAKASAITDFALWGGLTPNNLDQLEELANCGVIGFKAFMSNSGIADFTAADEDTLYTGMQRAARLGKIVAVHAESDALTTSLAAKAVSEGRLGVRDYLASRPVVAELEAIQRALLFAEETGCALHIVHVSSGQGIAMIAESRARGVDVSSETCPHYLVLSEEDVERFGAIAKCAPPIRSSEVQATLWERLLAGQVDLIASDHSPAPPSMKGVLPAGEQDVLQAHPQAPASFFEAWGGISGVQSTLGLLLEDGYAKRNLSLELIAALTSTNVAARFGLAERKGYIAPGQDADLALVDLQAAAPLRRSELHDRHRLSPYVGRTLRGQVVRTIRRGETIFADGVVVAHAGGEYISL